MGTWQSVPWVLILVPVPGRDSSKLHLQGFPVQCVDLVLVILGELEGAKTHLSETNPEREWMFALPYMSRGVCRGGEGAERREQLRAPLAYRKDDEAETSPYSPRFSGPRGSRCFAPHAAGAGELPGFPAAFQHLGDWWWLQPHPSIPPSVPDPMGCPCSDTPNQALQYISSYGACFWSGTLKNHLAGSHKWNSTSRYFRVIFLGKSKFLLNQR